MKITFVSNYLSHHQVPFCNEMYKLLGDDFRFVATQKMDEDRVEMGWKNEKPFSYELRAYENKSIYDYCINLCWISDVVIIGSASDGYISRRLEEDLMTFRYSERLFKKGLWRLFSPRAMLGYYKAHIKYRKNNNLHMLCASAYTPLDVSRLKAYTNKVWKWGYFTELKKYNLDTLFAKKDQKVIKLLWVGRFISWKHPEKAVEVIRKLTENGYDCYLDFIGSGENEIKLKKMVKKYHLTQRVRFLGSMPHEKVRSHMETANIFLFTSDKQEGWGAVLNEAMNSGCAVIASHASGSVPFLISHEENGLIYKGNSLTDLYNKVEILVKDKEIREKLGRNAIMTMENMWNANVAADRILEFSKNLMRGIIINYQNGPLSRAKIMKD